MQSFVLRRRRQAYRPKKSATRARVINPSSVNWSHRWDLPLNASKCHHLSIGGTPNLRTALPEEAAGKSLQKCEQINALGITANASFTPSANVLGPANKVRGMLYFIKRSLTCLTKEIFVPLYSGLERPHLEYAIEANCPYLKKGINHLERIQRAATLCVKGLKGLTYEERLQALKLQSQGKRRLKKRSGPDPQRTSQPYRSGRNSIVQVLQKARTKKIITKTASSNR